MDDRLHSMIYQLSNAMSQFCSLELVELNYMKQAHIQFNIPEIKAHSTHNNRLGITYTIRHLCRANEIQMSTYSTEHAATMKHKHMRMRRKLSKNYIHMENV